MDVIRRSFFGAVSGNFTGLKNYINVCSNQAFRLAAKNTVLFLCCLHSNTYYTVVNNCSTFKWTEVDKKAAFENSIFAAYGNKGYLTGNFMDKIENSLQENLNNKILKRYGKCIILWLIAGMLFYSGMKNYCNIEKK